MSNILSCFDNKKPIIGVIHTKGADDNDIFDRAVKEIQIYEENALDAVLVETYFGDYNQVKQVLGYLAEREKKICYGVNCLNVDAMGFQLATEYKCDFIQVDSVVGHVKPRDEAALHAFFEIFRKKCPAYLMGGVRFKYQPVLSGNTVEEDLKIGMSRCDAICVTGEATGKEAPLSKLNQFRSVIGNYPMFVCSGVTADNIKEQLDCVDGAIVGSYFKDNYQDNGDVCAKHVRQIMEVVEKYRQAM